MKRLIASLAAALVALSASAATLSPVQLLNPAGSSSGQAIISTGSSTAPTWGSVSSGSLGPQAANTVIANATGSSASPTAFAMPSCSATGNVLNWTTSTGFTCGTGYALLNAPLFTGGIGVAGGLAVSSGGASIAAGGLSVVGTVSGTGFSNYLASPPAIGGSAAAAGAFTTLSASSTVSGAGFTSLLSPYAPLASPALTGTPTAPTQGAGSNSTAVATTAFVQTSYAAPPALGSTTPAAVSATALLHSQQERDTSYTFSTPTTGQTVTMASGTQTALISPAGTLANLTITMPGCTAGYDGSLARFVSFQTITALTLNATSGSVVDPVTSLAIGVGHAYICRGAATAWYPLY